MSENQPEQEMQPHGRPEISVVQRTTTIAGPLPPPAILQQYDQIVPGAAERILTKFEEQSRHRQKIESQVITSDIRQSTRGLHFAFAIGLIAIIGGIVLAYNGQPVYGTIFGGAYLVAVLSIFIYGSQRRQKERKERER